MKFFLLFFCSYIGAICAQPPRSIPSDLRPTFTLNGAVPIMDFYLDNTVSSETNRETKILLENGIETSYYYYSKEEIESYIVKINNKETHYYGPTDTWLYQALEAYPIKGKDVLIIGSTIPWYESVIIAYGGRPTTVEYTKIITDDPRLTVMTVDEFNQNPKKFDVILSISSIEHDGLGRYGDPINPTADLEFMAMAKHSLLKDEGVMFLAVPVGRDCLVWNAHRIYGKLRLPLLLKGWHIVDTFGIHSSEFSRELGQACYQPVFYLTNHPVILSRKQEKKTKQLQRLMKHYP